MATRSWERQQGESTPAFAAFAAYRDQGVDRSIRSVAQQLGKSRALLDRWSKEHRWVQRVEAYDRHMDQVAVKAQAKARQDMVDRHARMAGLFHSKIVERLQSIDAATLTPRDLMYWFDTAVRIERQARGEPDSRQEVTGPGGDPLQVQVATFADLPPDQRRLAIEQMLDTVQRRTRAVAGVDDDDE